jgi:DNA-binding transcriptional MerR regulator
MNSEKHILMIIRTDVAPEMEEEFNRWYNEEHIPLLLRVPGVLWAKRGVNIEEGQKYIAVYEHESVEVQQTPAYRNALETDWTHRIRPHLRNFKREIYGLLK